MMSFLNFDLQISSPNPKNGLARELRELAMVLEYEDESSDIHTPDDSAMVVDSTSGDKRKM
jgi:hypothetical protein